MEKLIAWGLTTLIGAFIGSFLASYLKKKGENLAIQEDLDKLLEQVRAVTTTTKEIEAKVSTDLWTRQKRWEMKREVVFEATKRLVALENALVNLSSTYETERKLQQPSGFDWWQAKGQVTGKFGEASKDFEETGLLVGIVCGKDLKKMWDSFRLFAGQIAIDITNDDPEIYAKSVADLSKKFIEISTEIRKELETDKTT